MANNQKRVEDALRQVHIFAVDIEAEGQYVSKNNIVSIGTAHGPAMQDDGPALMRVSLQPDPTKSFEPRCLTEFWNRPEQVAQLKIFRAEAVPTHEALRTFLDTLRKAEEEAAKAGATVYVVSDNPSYDFSFLNHNLDVHLSHPSLAFSELTGKYRGVCDEWEVLRTVAHKHDLVMLPTTPDVRSELEAAVAQRAVHDHMPEHDAAAIYWRTVLLCRNGLA